MYLVYPTIIVLTCMTHSSALSITVINGGKWGDWSSDWARCRSPATGFRQKVEAYQGSGDDTALNGILLLCGRDSITNQLGPWGHWGGSFYCPNGGYLVAFSLKVEPSQGSGDDTAANGIKFRCSNGAVIEDPNGGPWGSWGPWSNSCPQGSRGFCSMMTKVEDYQRGDDDTALNDVRFLCC